MASRYAYWQHDMPTVGLCPVQHRWHWTSRLHSFWRNLRFSVGARIAGL